MKSIIYRHKLPFPWSQFQYIFSSKFNNIAHIWYYLPVLMSSEPLFLSRNTWFYSWRFLLKSAGNGLKGLGCAAAAMSHNVSKHQLCVWKTVGFQILKCQSIDAPLGIVSFVWSRQPTLLSAYQFNWYLFLRYLQYLPFPHIEMVIVVKWFSRLKVSPLYSMEKCPCFQLNMNVQTPSCYLLCLTSYPPS